MKIIKNENSQFNSELFKTTKEFGKQFTDHMLFAEYKNGEWSEAEIRPFGNLEMSPATMAWHYGQAIFEGMKSYKNDNGEVLMFRPEMNFKRFNASATRMAMPEVPEETFLGGLHALLDIDRDWVPPIKGMSLYMRPVMFASEAMINARAAKEYYFLIICSIAPDYYNKPLSVKIETEYSRAAPGGIGYAKAAGNYAASFHPTSKAREAGFDQIIWTDASTHTKIEEAGTMNIFVRVGDELFTAALGDSILPGVTRNSVIKIANDLGVTVNETDFYWKDMQQAHKDGKLMEVFGCGTAVVVNNFCAIGYPDETLTLEDLPEEKSIGKQIKSQLTGIQNGDIEDKYNWTVVVKSQN